MDLPGDPNNGCMEGDYLQFQIGKTLYSKLCGLTAISQYAFRRPKHNQAETWVLKAMFQSDIFENPPHMGFHSEIFLIHDECYEDEDDDEDDPDPLPPFNCGIPDLPSLSGASRSTLTERVANGFDTDIHYVPWIVGIYPVWNVHNTSLFFRAGTLITDRHVLTFAIPIVYIRPTDLVVIAGMHNLTDPGELHLVECVSQQQVFDYDYVNPPAADLMHAILTLSQPITVGPTIKPVCLPDPNHILDLNRPIFASGWGAGSSNGSTPKNTLQTTTLIHIPNDICQTKFIQANETLTPNLLCTGGLNQTGSDVCMYDEGGDS